MYLKSKRRQVEQTVQGVLSNELVPQALTWYDLPNVSDKFSGKEIHSDYFVKPRKLVKQNKMLYELGF